MQDTDIQVLIVGAGPVGLFLANECARRGLTYRIVEARSGQSVHSKALAVFPFLIFFIFRQVEALGPFFATSLRPQ